MRILVGGARTLTPRFAALASHYMIQYVAAPEVFRARLVSETNPTYKAQLKASYEWLKTHWYGGLEFHTLAPSGAEIQRVALQCGPGQC